MTDKKTHFKGWKIPGPDVPGGVAVREGETLDALSGQYKIFQLKKGHRFSTDDVIVAWYGTSHGLRAERVLDLGSGLGTVAMIAAWRLPFAKFVTVEAQEQSQELQLRSLEYNGLLDRVDSRRADFRDAGVFHGPHEQFDLVLGSPPYFPLEAGVHGDHPQKIACRFEVRGTVADYLRVAHERLAPGGMASVVFPIDPAAQRERVYEGARKAGLAVLRERPVALLEGATPLLGLFLFMRQEDLPAEFPRETFVEPVLTIRRKDGTVDPEYSIAKLSIGFPP